MFDETLQGFILNPNCSEAVCRIRIDRLTDAEKEKLDEAVDKLMKNDEMDWTDNTRSGHERIFGIECLIIDGDLPYNGSEDIDKTLHQLPFFNKLQVEYSE